LTKKILIAGGGIGGYVAAKRLVDGIRSSGVDAEVTVINKEPYHFMPPLFFDVALGYASTDETRAPIQNMEKYGIKVTLDEIQSIDAANRTVVGAKSKYQYDYLLVSLGIDYGWGAYPNLDKEGVHNFDLDGALKMKEALNQVKDGQNVTLLIPELPYRCGIYPYEAATVLSSFFRSRNKKVSVRLLDPMPAPIIPLGSAISRFIADQFAYYGVEYVPNFKLREIDPSKKTVVGSSGEFKYDLLVKVPPSRLPKALANSGEDFTWKQDPRWAPVLPNGRHPKYDDVYLASEHSLPPLGIGLAGVFVESLAVTAATNMLADLVGGFGPAFMPSPVSCVGYAGDKGWSGTCELPFDASKGMYAMKCYFGGVYSIGRLLKQGFYHGWIGGLKF
jgi:sulfide:quinone oxidoreductase